MIKPYKLIISCKKVLWICRKVKRRLADNWKKVTDNLEGVCHLENTIFYLTNYKVIFISRSNKEVHFHVQFHTASNRDVEKHLK